MIGGIAAINAESGKVEDCYSIWNGSYKRAKRAIVAQNNGIILTSVLVHNAECDSLYDSAGILKTDYRVGKTTDIKNAGFDIQKTWEYTGDQALLSFNVLEWKERCKPDNKRTVIHIRDAKGFTAFADRVNKSDSAAINALVILDNDISFGGRHIPVIGIKRECAFCGIFDGQGHLVWNGAIKNEGALYAALFGYLKGMVLNLIFDGRITSENNMGGLCGLNQGEIACCGALVRTRERGDRGNVGGLVVLNEGTIRKSYSVFVPRLMISPLVLIAFIAAGFIMLGSLGYVTVATAMDVNREYAVVEVDPRQEKIEGLTTGEAENNVVENKTNTISFSFNEQVIISRTKGTCKLNFINRIDDKNKLVIMLQVENASGERATVASAKAVLPGYGIEYLELVDGAEQYLEGASNGLIVLIPYDVKTDNLSMVNTELPVRLMYED